MSNIPVALVTGGSRGIGRAAEWGRIDVLFNSAGVSIPGTLELGADTLDLL